MITLDTIRAAADKKYGPVQIDLGDGTVVDLVNILRLSKDAKDKFAALGAKLEGAESDDLAIDAIDEVLIAISSDRAAGKRLVAALGRDLPTYLEVLAAYNEGASVGEA